jgi:hypothetical protein
LTAFSIADLLAVTYTPNLTSIPNFSERMIGQASDTHIVVVDLVTQSHPVVRRNEKEDIG